jgi:broad specificity phosphatase PhoE
MAGKTILIMRHAEKSSDPMDPDLSSAGRTRAQQLASYIPATFGKPNFLLASAESKHSRRPIETLEPLAATCGLAIDDHYADQDYGALAHDLRKDAEYSGALSVVCWHHGNIPNLMHALKAATGDYPDPWDRDVFNLILRLDIQDDGTPKVTQVTEPF